MNRSVGDSAANDADLVERARSGDHDAFAGLMLKYQDRVYNACLRICSNRTDAADLTQTTFVRALESLGKFESRSNFYTWLFRIAANASLSLRRTHRRRPTASLDGAMADHHGAPYGKLAADGEIAPVERAERREELDRLAVALSKVDEEFRVALVLRDIEGLDYSAIAEILGVPVGTVKSRIHRGRTMLRELMRGDCSVGRSGPTEGKQES